MHLFVNVFWQRYALVVAVSVLMMVCPVTVLAEPEDLAERLERLEQIVIQQQAELEENRQKLAEQAELINELQNRQSSTPGAVSGSGPEIETDPVSLAEQAQPSGTESPAVAGSSSEEDDPADASSGQQAAVAELTRREQEGTAVREVDSQATLYDPSSTVFDPNFPGAWHLPGTTAAMKLGGYVNLALINSFDPLLSSDRFIVGSIPPEGTTLPGARAGTAVSASQTRLNLEVRQQTAGGPLRAFVEGDFEGDGDSFRMRHAYGQYGWLLAGKTWSTFANLESRPEEVDFEGINGAVLLRQSQLRFFPKFGGQNSFVFSIEDPSTDIENGTGSKGQGDFVFSVDRLPLGGLGAWNYKVSAILRDLEGTPAGAGDDDTLKTQSTTGWGITTSGRKSFAKMRDNNFLLWQLTYGEGIGRYLNDLGTIGGGDATFDPDGRLRALPVLAGFREPDVFSDPGCSPGSGIDVGRANQQGQRAKAPRPNCRYRHVMISS